MKLDQKKYKYIFVAALFFLQALFFVGLIKDYNGDQANVFFLKANNYLADYINVAKYAADRNPYFDTTNGGGEHAYFPLVYVIFWVLSKLSNYSSATPDQAGYTYLSMAEINLFLIFMTVIFMLILRNMIDENKLINDLLLMSLLGSGIYLLSYERGNIVFLSVIGVSIYLNYYESENIIEKHIAFAALAVAAAIKGFPAIFGVLLLYKRKWKDAVWLVLYGILMCLGPFALLVNGFRNIPQWLINLSLNNSSYKYRIFPRFGYLAFLSVMPEQYIGYRNLIDVILKIILLTCCVIMVIANYGQAKQWKKNLALTLILILVPINSAIYCGLYMFPIIVMFFNEKEHDKYDLFFVLLFILFCNPFQIIWREHNITWYLSNISLMIMFVILLGENMANLCRALKGKINEYSHIRRYRLFG